MNDDDMSNADFFTGDELYEMDRDAEFRLDAEDDARNTADVEAGRDDGEPWEGLADGEER